MERQPRRADTKAVRPAGHGQAKWIRSCAICRRRRPGDELLTWHDTAWPPRLTRLGGRACGLVAGLEGLRLASDEGSGDDTAVVPQRPADLRLCSDRVARQGRGSSICPQSRCLDGWLRRHYGRSHGRQPPPETVAAVMVGVQQLVQLLENWRCLRAAGLQRRGLDPDADGVLAVWRGVQDELAAVTARHTGAQL